MSASKASARPAWPPAAPARPRFDAGELPDFRPRPRPIRDGDWRVGPDPGRAAGPSRRDHRPGRPQDDHQRAELRRQGVHGRLRGRNAPTWANQMLAARANLRDAIAGTIEFTADKGKPTR
jgi:malate synthase